MSLASFRCAFCQKLVKDRGGVSIPYYTRKKTKTGMEISVCRGCKNMWARSGKTLKSLMIARNNFFVENVMRLIKMKWVVIFGIILIGCKQDGYASGPNPNPDPGNELEVTNSYTCQKSADSIQSNLRFIYERVEFSNGLAAITCTVHNHAKMVSRSKFAAPGQNSNCEVLFDLGPNASFGTWRFTSSAVQYVDSDDARDGLTVEFLPDDCQ